MLGQGASRQAPYHPFRTPMEPNGKLYDLT